MGLCFSSRTNILSDPYYGGNDSSRSSSKVSSATVPSASRTTGEILQSPSLESFGFSELQEATTNFGPDAVLEEGDFGSVYKGWLDKHSLKPVGPETGMAIAVKILNPKGCQGREELLAEIKYMGQLYHPNLVKLIGYCLEDDHRVLVYEFMPNGSLKNHLFRNVIYRDFKTSNILLDLNYNAKLSDLGLAKDGPIGCKSHISTRVLCTEGYGAPEYIRTGHLTAKSDVYSFGVVLLEMLSGRRAMDRSKPSEEQNLAKWARSMINARKISQVMNPAILVEHSGSSVLKVAQLACQCVSAEPKFRPTMKEVVQVLEELQDSNDNKKYKGSNRCKSNNSSKDCRRT